MAKLKVWHIYLICIAIIPFTTAYVLGNMGYGTGEGLGYDVGSWLFWIALVGGIILTIHYSIQRSKKK